MTLRYITGYDGSDASRAALRFGRRLADLVGAEVIAANVFHQPRRVAGKGDLHAAVAELDEAARRDAEDTLDAISLPVVTHVAVGASSPAAGLHHLAEDQDAALIAVGVTHRGPVGRLVPGGVGDQLLHGAPCPVAVIPEGWPTDAVATVAAAYDGTEESRAALHTAEELARFVEARLVVIAVSEPLYGEYLTGMSYAAPELDRERRQELEREVSDLLAGMPGLETEARVPSGPAPRTLVEAAHDDVDLLVTGSRAYGPVRAVLLGSVARHLIDHAPCPVLVVPRGTTARLVPSPAATATHA